MSVTTPVSNVSPDVSSELDDVLSGQTMQVYEQPPEISIEVKLERVCDDGIESGFVDRSTETSYGTVEGVCVTDEFAALEIAKASQEKQPTSIFDDVINYLAPILKPIVDNVIVPIADAVEHVAVAIVEGGRMLAAAITEPPKAEEIARPAADNIQRGVEKLVKADEKIESSRQDTSETSAPFRAGAEATERIVVQGSPAPTVDNGTNVSAEVVDVDEKNRSSIVSQVGSLSVELTGGSSVAADLETTGSRSDNSGSVPSSVVSDKVNAIGSENITSNGHLAPTERTSHELPSDTDIMNALIAACIRADAEASAALGARSAGAADGRTAPRDACSAVGADAATDADPETTYHVPEKNDSYACFLISVQTESPMGCIVDFNKSGSQATMPLALIHGQSAADIAYINNASGFVCVPLFSLAHAERPTRYGDLAALLHKDNPALVVTGPKREGAPTDHGSGGDHGDQQEQEQRKPS